MQTTLLTAAIAIILALVAALVGPLLIDWGTYRSLFEARGEPAHRPRRCASRARIDARLLPSPQLTLARHRDRRGDDADPRAFARHRIRARAADARRMARHRVASSPGRNCASASTPPGTLHAPAPAINFKPDALSIDRLSIEDGRADAHRRGQRRAASRSSRLWFNGEARSLLGPFNGEGDVARRRRALSATASPPAAMPTTARSSSRSTSIRVDRPLSIEADGTLTLRRRRAAFDGALSLTRPVGIARARRRTGDGQPWRLSGKIKASAAAGADGERSNSSTARRSMGIKLTGVADFKFGKTPRFEGVLSGRQIDLDGALGGDRATRASPGAALRQLAELARGAFRPGRFRSRSASASIRSRSAAACVQNLRGDISADADGWDLKTLRIPRARLHAGAAERPPRGRRRRRHLHRSGRDRLVRSEGAGRLAARPRAERARRSARAAAARRRSRSAAKRSRSSG